MNTLPHGVTIGFYRLTEISSANLASNENLPHGCVTIATNAGVMVIKIGGKVNKNTSPDCEISSVPILYIVTYPCPYQ